MISGLGHCTAERFCFARCHLFTMENRFLLDKPSTLILQVSPEVLYSTEASFPRVLTQLQDATDAPEIFGKTPNLAARLTAQSKQAVPDRGIR